MDLITIVKAIAVALLVVLAFTLIFPDAPNRTYWDE